MSPLGASGGHWQNTDCGLGLRGRVWPSCPDSINCVYPPAGPRSVDVVWRGLGADRHDSRAIRHRGVRVESRGGEPERRRLDDGLACRLSRAGDRISAGARCRPGRRRHLRGDPAEDWRVRRPRAIPVRVSNVEHHGRVRDPSGAGDLFDHPGNGAPGDLRGRDRRIRPAKWFRRPGDCLLRRLATDRDSVDCRCRRTSCRAAPAQP